MRTQPLAIMRSLVYICREEVCEIEIPTGRPLLHTISSILSSKEPFAFNKPINTLTLEHGHTDAAMTTQAPSLPGTVETSGLGNKPRATYAMHAEQAYKHVLLWGRIGLKSHRLALPPQPGFFAKPATTAEDKVHGAVATADGMHSGKRHDAPDSLEQQVRGTVKPHYVGCGTFLILCLLLILCLHFMICV